MPNVVYPEKFSQKAFIDFIGLYNLGLRTIGHYTIVLYTTVNTLFSTDPGSFSNEFKDASFTFPVEPD